MTFVRPASRAGALLIAFVLIVAACSGTPSSSAPTASSGAGATTTPPAVTSAPGSPSAAVAESPAASLPFAIPSFDIGELTKGLENVDSYRVTLSVNGVDQYKGVVVTKPVLSRDITVTGGTRIVVIGSDAWTAQGDEPLKPVPAQLATAMFAAFDPTLFVGAFSSPQWAQSSLDKGTEQKNGINAQHFLIDSSTVVGGFAGLPAGASINFWVADEGYLVALETKGIGAGDTSIQVTGVDDPANKVERPS